MLNALVIDDESLARESLVYLLQEYCTDAVRVTGSANGAAEARKILVAHEAVNTLFLDISMPHENGFDFLASLPEGKYLVVFVTAYNQYALRAIKANAVDYLTKPVDIAELRAAVQKLERMRGILAADPAQQALYQASMQNALEDIQQPKRGVTRLTLPQQQGLTIIDVKNIVHLEADSNYTIFVMNDGKKIIVAKTLKEFEDVLDEAVFVRIHKSHILHLEYLKSFSAMHNTATTTNGTVLSVSRRRWTEFTNAVANYSKKV